MDPVRILYRYANVNMYSSDYIKKAYNRSDVTAEISVEIIVPIFIRI